LYFLKGGTLTNHVNDPAPTCDNPVLVEVRRADFLESRHRGAIAVVDCAGNTVFSAGDIDVPIYPRSSLKPLQTLALVESGAMSGFGLDTHHVCLACASHSGEDEHTRWVTDWLAKIGLTTSDLECGSHPPYSEAVRDDMVRAGTRPAPVQNNCSGKHAGFLSVARHMKVDHRHYIDPEHPVQKRVTGIVEEACDFALSGQVPAVDGCGIPVYGIPLRNLAHAFARFAPAARGSDVRSQARGEIVDSILRHPFLIAGSGRFCTRMIEKSGRGAIMKTGAEGVFTGTLLGEGLGIALKIDDGASRASEVLMAAVLRKFTGDDSFAAALDREASVNILNAAGREVGHLTATSIASL
jgi:L-asparaginase II